MNLLRATTMSVSSLSIIATPLLAQERERLSRECRRDVVKVCGRDRSEIFECLQTQLSGLKKTCQEEVGERMEERLERHSARNRRAIGRAASVQPSSSLSYGRDERQEIDFFPPQNSTNNAPLIMHIHGGGWTIGSRKAVDAKPLHFTKSGYAFASAGYRLMPSAPVEQQAMDLGSALRLLRQQADVLGINSDQIVIMGHSAGAHLAALIATDPKYAGNAFGSLKGVILLDGAAYNIPRKLSSDDAALPSLFRRVFGDDIDRQTELSPTTHVGGRDAPNWLVLHDAARRPSGDRSRELGNALKQHGVSVEVLAINETDHSRLNREIGMQAGTQQTQAIDAFLSQLFE